MAQAVYSNYNSISLYSVYTIVSLIIASSLFDLAS